MQAEEDKRRNSEGIRLLCNYIPKGVRRCCGLHFQRMKGGERLPKQSRTYVTYRDMANRLKGREQEG